MRRAADFEITFLHVLSPSLHSHSLHLLITDLIFTPRYVLFLAIIALTLVLFSNDILLAQKLFSPIQMIRKLDR